MCSPPSLSPHTYQHTRMHTHAHTLPGSSESLRFYLPAGASRTSQRPLRPQTGRLSGSRVAVCLARQMHHDKQQEGTALPGLERLEKCPTTS